MSSTTETMSSTTETWFWRKVGWLSLLCLLVFYFFSLGPVVRAVNNSRGAWWVRTFVPSLEVIYTPIKWLHRNTPLRKPIESYVNWWSKP